MSAQLQVTGEAKIRDLQGPVVANSGIITALDGLPSQYVRGDGTLADIPSVTGGGASVSYYLNGSVNQGTFGGSTYYQLGENAITGVGTNFSTSTDGLLAQFITDAGVPDVTEIPSGNWNIEFYMGVSASSGALASFYVEIYKYDGTTFTLIGTNITTPEFLTNTTTVDAYFTSVAMPFTVLAQTDRIAIRVYASVASKTVTMYTEDNRLCQVVTTFSRGMLSLNSLTDQQQYLTVGTAGTDFNIVSSVDTHTFNIPSASATNRGLITTGTQTIAGDKTLSGNNSFSGSNTFTQDLLINSVSAGRGAGNFTSNTRFGNDSFSANTSGENNSAFGLWSLRANTTGNGNAAFGFFSLSSNTTGGSNVAIGSNALTLNTTANGGVAIGQSALSKNTSGGFNVAVGYEALRENDIQSGNVAVGRSALRLSIAYNNTAIGDSSMALNTTGTLNTALGYYSLNANTTGSENVSIGSNTLKTNTTGSLNVAVGTNALNKNTIGNGNNAIGAYALLNNTSGYINTALGNTALQSNTTGSGNVAVGNSTLESNTTGVNNVGIGQASLFSNTTGNYNTAVGISTLQNTLGSNNTVIGHKAGELIYTGSNNTIVGVYQGTSAMSNNVILADGQGNIRYQFDGTKNIFNNPVDLGAWGLTASGVTANSYNAIGNGTQGGYIYLKQGTTPYAGLVGANGISADGTKFLLISNVSIAQDKVALFDFGSLTNNTARTYTFPDASGTIALTSNLSSYVPYTGATGSVNLGIYSLSSNGLNIFGSSVFNANSLYQKAGLTAGGLTDYITVYHPISGNGVSYYDGTSLTSASLVFDTTGSRTYTFPASSGTVALTSNLSSYVPYTGATSDVNLGMFSITTTSTSNAQIFNANGSAGSAGQISMKWGTGFSAATGYSTLGGFNNGFLLISNIAGNQKFGIFDLSTLTTSVQRTYTLPDASGTLALTSNLSAYLPLTGGTLTGALSGTSATFSSNVGIGVAASSDMLNVLGTNNNNAAYFLGGATSGQSFGVQIRAGSSITDYSFLVQSRTGSDYFRVRGDGNVGIGTSSPDTKLQVAATGSTGLSVRTDTSGDAFMRLYRDSTIYAHWYADRTNSKVTIGSVENVPLTFDTNATERMRITSGGNVGIGTSSNLSSKLVVNGGLAIGNNWGVSGATINIDADATGSNGASLSVSYWSGSYGPMIFKTSDTERMRIQSDGFIKMTANKTLEVLQVSNTGTSGGRYGIVTVLDSSASNTSNYQIICTTNVGDRMYVYGNGNIVNINNSYGTLSDVSLKENITDATPKLDDLLQLKVRNFNLIGDETKQIGFIAQEFEEIFPKMVDIDGKSGKKMIKTSVLVPMLVKAIQEQQAQIEELKALIAAK